MKAIKVALFEDHPATAAGTQSLLEQQEQIEVVAWSATLEDLHNQLQNLPIDLLIADVIAPGNEGLRLFKEMRETRPQLPIIAYTALNNRSLANHLRAMGVKGLVNKRKPFDELIKGIEIVSDGGICFSQLESTTHSTPKNSVRIEALSARELEILQLIAKGLLTKEIASRLQISTNTVSAHRTKLFEKLHVQNLGELLQEARQLGYLDD